jgi:hypothetical protein
LGGSNYKNNIWTRGFAIIFVFTIAVFETQNWSPEKTLNFVTFSEFLTHPCVHHTNCRGHANECPGHWRRRNCAACAATSATITARSAWRFGRGVGHIAQHFPPLLEEVHAPHSQSESEEEEAMIRGFWVMIVMVV